MADGMVRRFVLGAALGGLLLTALPSTLPAWAAASHRRPAAIAPHRAFFPRITHQPSGARTAGNRLSVFSSNDALATPAPRSSSATTRLAPRLPAANPVVPAAWTALGANPVQNEVSLCTSPPNLQQCGSYGSAAGRVTSLAVDPTNPNTVFAGSAGGGVWKSTNAGVSWTPLTDTQASLAIGALAISPNGQTIYAGTGEDNRSDSQIGQGVLISINGGLTWTLSGQSIFANHYIGGVAIDRNNTNHVFVASDVGLYETGDGGSTWQSDVASYITSISSLQGGPATSGAVRQIIQDPSDANANDYWLSVSDDCQSEGGDVLRSTNNGATWAVMPLAGVAGQAASRIAVGAGTGGIAYLSAAGCSGNLIDAEVSLNGGTGWVQLFGATEYDPFVNPVQPYQVHLASPGLVNYFNSDPTSHTSFGQGSYDNSIAVDPSSPARAVFGGVTALTTITAGGGFTDVGHAYQANKGLIHPDYHAFAFWSHDHLFAGTDGGVYKTNDLGGTGFGGDWTNVSAGMDTLQYYGGVALDAGRVLGGAQDNGSPGNFAGAGTGSLPTAAEYLDGDGTYTAVDPNSTAVWASYPGLGIFKGSSSAPLSSMNLAAPCSTGSEAACHDPVEFVAPYLLDSSGGGQQLVAGTSKVYYSGSGGTPGSWTAISGALVNPSIPCPNSAPDKLQVLALTPAGVTGEVMAASRYGEVSVSTQIAGMRPNLTTWKDVTSGLPPFPCYGVPGGAPTAVEPNGWFSGITINPANANEAWVAIGGLHVQHVWHTTNLN